MPRFKIRDYVNSITLDGATSFLAKASPTGINNGTNGSVTISGWVYLTSNVLGTFAELHVNGGTSPAFGIGQSGGAYYVFSDRVNAGNNKTITTATFNNSVGLNRWVMLTYVLTSTNITVYAGATAILPTAALGTAINAGTISSLFIGKGQDVGQVDIQFLAGIIKDFRVYSAALSSTEVSDLYYNNIVPTSVVATYAMSEGSGTTVADSTGSNSMTATSITWGTDVPFAARSAASNRFLIRNNPYSVYINGVDGAAPNALSFANSPTLNPTAAVTVEIWFRPVNGPKSYILFDNSEGGTTNSYFASGDSAGRISWFSTIGGVARNLVNSSSLRVRWNEWNFFCGTYTGSAVNLFLNGSQYTEQITGISGSLGTNSGILRIGAYYTGALGITFLGNLYRPRVYAAGMTLAEHQDRYYRNITSTALQAALGLDCGMTEGSGTTIADLSGNGNTGTLNASSSWNATDAPYKPRLLIRPYDYSLNFNGVNQYVTLGAGGSIAAASSAFSVAGWFKQTGPSSGILTIAGDTGGSLARFYLQLSAGRISAFVATTGTSAALDSTQAFDINEWNHCVLTYDGATAKVYVNGGVFITAVCTGTCTASTSGMAIGRGFGPARYFLGQIGRVQYWTRALTQDEITDIYYNGADETSSSIRTGMTGEWLLDEGSGTTAFDTVGSNNGTITGATYTTDTPLKARTQIT